MTRDDIILMAREAGMEQDGDNFFSPNYEEIDVHITDLERFAKLVAKKKGSEIAMQIISAAIAAEREACAKVCETQWSTFPEHRHGYDLAASIRARGNVTKGKENHA